MSLQGSEKLTLWRSETCPPQGHQVEKFCQDFVFIHQTRLCYRYDDCPRSTEKLSSKHFNTGTDRLFLQLLGQKLLLQFTEQINKWLKWTWYDYWCNNNDGQNTYDNVDFLFSFSKCSWHSSTTVTCYKLTEDLIQYLASS